MNDRKCRCMGSCHACLDKAAAAREKIESKWRRFQGAEGTEYKEPVYMDEEDTMVEESPLGAQQPECIVRLKLITGFASPPTKAYRDDACFDLYARHDQLVDNLAPAPVRCGFAMALPDGWEAQIRPRSGLALKHNLTILNAPGTIDAGYRGEIVVNLRNLGSKAYEVKRGDRIAQMTIKRVPRVELRVADELDETERGAGGFGSSGR